MKPTNYNPQIGLVIQGAVYPGTAHGTGLIGVGDGTITISPTLSLLFTGAELTDGGSGAATISIDALDKKLRNKTGGVLAYGDVVIVDTTNDEAVTATATPRIETTIGVAIENIFNNSIGRIRIVGFVNSVNVGGNSVRRGFYMETNSVLLQAGGNSARRSGSFGQFLRDGVRPSAWLWGSGDPSGGGGGSSPLTTKGDVWGFSSVDARIPVGGNSTFLMASSIDALGVAWGTPSGGGGGSDLIQSYPGSGSAYNPGLRGNPDVRPASPNANDDEFETLSGWTTLGTLDSGTPEVTTWPSHLYLLRTMPGEEVNGIYKAAPSIPFTMVVKLAGVAQGFSTNRAAGILLLDSTPAAMYMATITENTGFGAYYDLNTSTWSNRTTRTGNADHNMSSVSNGAAMVPLYMRWVVHSSTNIDMDMSPDGFFWIGVVAGANPGFTVAKVGLCIAAFGGAATQAATFDWVRFS